MSSEFQREESIFAAVIALPPDQRQAYLDETCRGDADLRQGVEALLDSYQQDTGFLENPPSHVTLTRAALQTVSVTEKVGDRIGRYKLLQQIGEGGCGVVYMTEQIEPVRRQVALKIIKLGMDTKQVIARFEAERQALALMDHPNIAKVLDAGSTETGRPYFVMELVRGIKITEFCDKNNLPTDERLKLFIKVCHAVQHAHQKGIIHRDLKPSNILVTLDDGVPLPKVIDFGIAKATQQRLTDKTLFTAFEQFIGTPAYMSPEQAEMNAQGVDTRSDIYSLGVLLYELLTGCTPFESQKLLQAGVDEIRRIIREEEPQKPSTRLSTLLEGELTITANHRQTAPPKLLHQVRGDLDWIVMRSLEKDRNRRYETANGFARDVERYLSDEPVTARPPSTLYRFGKTARKHRLVFTAVAAVFIALAAGAIVSTAEAIRARRAERVQTQMRLEAEAAERFGSIELLCSQGKLDEAQKTFDLTPSATMRLSPTGAVNALNTLGDYHLSRQQWSAALSNFTLLVELNPDNHLNYHTVAPLLVEMQDTNAYRQFCRNIIARFKETTDPNVADRMAKDCLILRDAGVDPDVVEKLADKSVTLGNSLNSIDLPAFLNTKALAEYRRGNYQSALDNAQKSLSYNVSHRSGWISVETHAVMAMSLYRLNRMDAAGHELVAALLTAGNGPTIYTESLYKIKGRAWAADWFIAHALLDEAKADMVGVRGWVDEMVELQRKFDAMSLQQTNASWNITERAALLDALAGLLRHSGNSAGAEIVDNQRLHLLHSPPENDSAMIQPLGDLGTTLNREGKFAEAEVIGRERLATLRSLTNSAGDARIGFTIKALTDILRKEGKNDQIKTLLQSVNP